MRAFGSWLTDSSRDGPASFGIGCDANVGVAHTSTLKPSSSVAMLLRPTPVSLRAMLLPPGSARPSAVAVA